MDHHRRTDRRHRILPDLHLPDAADHRHLLVTAADQPELHDRAMRGDPVRPRSAEIPRLHVRILRRGPDRRPVHGHHHRLRLHRCSEDRLHDRHHLLVPVRHRHRAPAPARTVRGHGRCREIRHQADRHAVSPADQGRARFLSGARRTSDAHLRLQHDRRLPAVCVHEVHRTGRQGRGLHPCPPWP